MNFIADLHVHSHFSRATSRNLDPEHLALWGKKKGITLVGTGDFTHAGPHAGDQQDSCSLER
jgi:PHP family Zn ribbon phosphoesterase